MKYVEISYHDFLSFYQKVTTLRKHLRYLPDVTGRVTDPTLIVFSGIPMATDPLKHSKPDEPDALDLL